ncbi:pentatricopeptide repeat-containing protein At3g26782, mitochondrial-like [Dioscorea cayenensis subsp. rotundata]|uniref:Pentatricopeptide repeat-containing protein At3g26782, mitochondrial-like n=1 Tax=Dioscorea cayennensis subsp. rotundata TaxID=55577 RepID=A0AB40AI28_DIOCR|nr:pentatricopeptide repeat-containing protein At3g26782, mitochondrial-like [Dioscorea cayenensis subsp. rotundata]
MVFQRVVGFRALYNGSSREPCASWNLAIRRAADTGAPARVLELYRRMRAENVPPDGHTLPPVIKACAQLRDLSAGTELHRDAAQLGVLPNLIVSNSLISMYSKCGCFDLSNKVFDEMRERNVVSWSSMIGACAQHGRPTMALFLFKKMILERIRPNRPTFLNLIPCVSQVEDADELIRFIVEECLDSDLFIKNAAVLMYSRCGRIGIARRLFDGIENKDLFSWSAMIEAFTNADMFDETLKVLRQMMAQCVDPDYVTVLGIIGACSKSTLSSLRQAKFIHRFVVRHSFEQNLMVGTSLIDMYVKRGSLESARRVFDQMQERNLVTWSTMISGYGMHGKGEDALELFYHMKHFFRPDHIVFVSVLSACSHAGLIEGGWQCFNSMTREFGIVPRAEHYACMVDLLGRAGKLKEAREFIEQMPIKPDSSVWGSLLGACRIHPNVELAGLAARSLFELDSKNPGRYICLSNIYTSLGKIDEANQIRNLMRRRGVKKTDGYSVVEVKNKVYKFVVGDQMNPQSKLIYRELAILMDRIREEGYVPNTNFALHDVEEETKETSLYVHSEKLAIVFGLMNSAPDCDIRIHKNLRVCGDCHTASKFISKVTQRRIVMRDSHRFHHFSNGMCSCGDYW